VAAVIDEIVAAHLLQPIGELWLSTLKITLVPLVFVLVAHGMISLDRTGETGQSSVV
jgi:Na+/H+-dicarboxylate symporter